MKKIIIGNWKMNPTSSKEVIRLFSSLIKNINVKSTEVVVCPPFVYLEKLKKIAKKISLGAQDASFIDKGPFTGEVSADMLASIGTKYAILGHSERRALGEDNSLINKKVKSTLSSGLIPILCIGEKERDENHGYFNLVKSQLEECLKGVKKDLIPKVLIAYEPVWAISTTADRRDATAHDCEEMVIFIRKVISSLTSPLLAKKTRILYGGSVNERDAGEFLTKGGVDGLLVGKASLDSKKFLKIIDICEASKN
jgi:triosephosphate isomerase